MRSTKVLKWHIVININSISTASAQGFFTENKNHKEVTETYPTVYMFGSGSESRDRSAVKSSTGGASPIFHVNKYIRKHDLNIHRQTTVTVKKYWHSCTFWITTSWGQQWPNVHVMINVLKFGFTPVCMCGDMWPLVTTNLLTINRCF